MTAHSYEEKRLLFTKRERELLHAIKHGFSEDKLRAAAEKLRDAKLGIFKCQFTLKAGNQPYNFLPHAVAQQNKQIQKWLSMSAEEIVKSYATLSTQDRHEGSQREGGAEEPH